MMRVMSLVEKTFWAKGKNNLKNLIARHEEKLFDTSSWFIFFVVITFPSFSFSELLLSWLEEHLMEEIENVGAMGGVVDDMNVVGETEIGKYVICNINKWLVKAIDIILVQ